MGILMITTGGTIGAMPYDDPRRAPELVAMPPLGMDLVRDSLAHNFAALDCRCISAEPRDSKHINQKYMYDLVSMVETAPEDHILITHGTDRILQSAEFFYHQTTANPALTNKVIILTGSMIPLANGPESDGYQNLELSLQHLTEGHIKAGVYIVLSDYADNPDAEVKAWVPRLYSFQPGVYEKVYATDARYSRLQRI